MTEFKTAECWYCKQSYPSIEVHLCQLKAQHDENCARAKWISRANTKEKQPHKLVVTEEILAVALDAYLQLAYKGNRDYYSSMKAALQAVFDKVNEGSCYHSYKVNSFHEYPTCEKCGDTSQKTTKEMLMSKKEENLCTSGSSCIENGENSTCEGLQAELDILVEQILSSKDLAKLQEVTRMNFPDHIPEATKMVEKKTPYQIRMEYEMEKNAKLTKLIEEIANNHKPHHIADTGKMIEEKKEEEPKKQTLLEYAHTHPHYNGSMYQTMLIISEYLELNS